MAAAGHLITAGRHVWGGSMFILTCESGDPGVGCKDAGIHFYIDNIL